MMTITYTYGVVLTLASQYAPDERGFIVAVPDFPEIITQGEDLDDALSQASDALDEAVAGRLRTKQEIPVPSYRSNGHVVVLSTVLAAKAALIQGMKQANIKGTALAGVLHLDEKEVRRLMDPGHRSKMDTLTKALRAVGKRASLTIEDDIQAIG